jgi:hypothetical protein
VADNAWRWLRTHEPAGYEQLVSQLNLAAESLAASGQTELRQLAEAFTWCAEHGIALGELQTPDNLPKYREAAARLIEVTEGDESDEFKVGRMRELIDRIKRDPSRRATRAWARDWRGRKAHADHFVLGEGIEAIVVRGPGTTVGRIRLLIDRLVEWDLDVSPDLMKDIERTRPPDGLIE